MSDSEDDKPLVKAKSKPFVTKDMDSSSPQTNGRVAPAISIATAPTAELSSKRKGMTNGKTYKEASSDDEDDVPLTKKRKISLQNTKIEIEKRAEKEAKAIRASGKSDSKRKAKPVDSDDDVPLVKKRRSSTKANGIKKEESDDDLPLAKARPAPKSVKKEATPRKGKAKVKTEEDEAAEEAEEGYKWWEDPSKSDNSIKWESLEHNGVIFPPEYTPLPKNVSMLYNKEPVTMHPDAEEIAYAFGSMLNSEHNVSNPTFQKNFFTDFKAALDKTGGAKNRSNEKVKITKFELCDFTKIFEHVDAERQAKKALPASEKKAIKAAKDEIEKSYLYCTWDGRTQKVGNFRVEPPGLFRGRGEHPKTGHFKQRVRPEQITINIGEDAMVPKPPQGHKWKEVKHDQTGTWLAMWQENINGNYKYVMLAANSDVKGQSDHRKFEKARELKGLIDRIRKDYARELKDPVMAKRQRATAMYLIDKLALRAGNEKGEDEADTVGCCSLKFENISLKAPDILVFDFLGKDSIRFSSEVAVDPQVFKNIKLFKKEPKKNGDEIFDRLTTTGLNQHLRSYMHGLTAKVFRTYNASYTMSTLLQDLEDKGVATQTVAEKIKAYNDANREVAIICNHKRTIGATHDQQMEKMEDKIKGMRLQQWRLKQMILHLDSKEKKKHKDGYFDMPKDLDDDDWLAEHHRALVEVEKAKITKKFEKENEKLVSEKKKPHSKDELASRLEVITELQAKFKKERKTRKVIAEGKGPSIEKFEGAIAKLDDRIKAAMLQSEDRESNKEVALGTSKINYIDPRLTVVFSKKFNVPLERFFSKTLREKFQWAINSVDQNWKF